MKSKIQYKFGASVISLMLLITTGTSYLYSQDSLRQRYEHRCKLKHELFAGTGVAIMNKLSIESTGESLLHTRRTITPLYELGYSITLDNSWGLKTGFGGTIVSYNEYTSFVVPAGNEYAGYDLDFNNYDYFIENYNIFLLFCKRINLQKKTSISIEAGAQYNHIWDLYTMYSFELYNDDPNESTLFFWSILDRDRSNLWFFSYRAAVSLNYNFSPKHAAKIGLGFNYTDEVVATGSYSFENLPFESYGSLSLGMKFISIPIGYSYSF
jgi:hypothetical protein